MIDPRFYEVQGPLKASDIAALLGTTVASGDPDRAVSSVAAAADAQASDLTFLEEAGEHPVAAGIVLASDAAARSAGPQCTVIIVKQARSAFARAALKFIKLRELEIGDPEVHPASRIATSARLEPGVVIGKGASIGEGVRIGANAVIGPGVQIGVNSSVGANAVVRCALIGDSVRILSGAVVGEAGFGLAAGAGGPALSPHFGRVIMQNNTSLGANSTIDRGFLDDTVIGEGSHIDNLCHIGHNCRIGRNFAAAAFLGISGSCEIGDDVQFGGRVGLKDHLRVGTGARIAAGAGVLTDVPAGETWAGYPAKPLRTWMRELAWLGRAAQKRPAKDE
ncbi:MAG TPA: UDP-3-O-(3-hydroxymyristoyl)glucosamine N-acyltransferase [Hyphomonadaceae bacterium]|nr:UDP-3-O-(3-hydroxymyristoyl)glucosamine N-acyltransferase [Hyphomonadaceae bacterium]